MPRVFHLANFHSTNVGNGALISGTEHVLREDLPGGATFVQEPGDDYNFERRFDAEFVRRVNAESDLFLIGGAVAINGRAYLAQAGMRVDLPPELWARIERPIVLHGISYRFWEGQEFHHLDKFRATVQYLHDHPRALFGVRNDGTKAWLQRLLGVDLPKVIEVPDPALYLETDSGFHPELRRSAKNVLIAFNNEDEEFRFREAPGTTRGARQEALLRQMAKTVTQLFEEFPINLILCPHYLDDYRMIGEFIQYLPPRIAHRHTVVAGMQRAAQSPYFYGLYARADLVVAMRVHSMSPSIGLGVPVIPLVSQSRMTDFLDDIGLRDIAVAFNDPNFSETLLEKARAALQQPELLGRRLTKATGACRERTRAFNAQTAALL
jgi:polysaccharide pyruvyl transferase WcaK-like protein